MALGNPTVPGAGNCPAPSGWILERLLNEETVIALPSVVVSRRLLQQIGPFDEELVMCEDDELWLRLAEHSEIDGVDQPLTLVRRHRQHSGTDILAWRERGRVFEKALRARRASHLESMLRRLRAEMAAGLAKSPRLIPASASARSARSCRAHPTRGALRNGGGARWLRPLRQSCAGSFAGTGAGALHKANRRRDFMTTAVATTPSVSVILPTFNRLKYLRFAVGSVFAQTLADWELIIADDGSDGETRAYLSALQSEPRVRVIWLPHCGNPAAVRNCALRQARGEYLAFLDSDDEWLPTKLERQIGALRVCTGRRWSYTGAITIDASGEPYAPAATPRPHRGAILELLLMHEVSIWTPAVVADRRLVAEVGGFDEQLLLFEDCDLWLRLACRSEIDLIDEPLTRVRRSHDQHYGEAGHGDGMLASRHRALEKVRCLVTDPQCALAGGTPVRAKHSESSESARGHRPTRGGDDSAAWLHSLVALHGLVAGTCAGIAEAGGPARSARCLPTQPRSPPLREHLVVTPTAALVTAR